MAGDFNPFLTPSPDEPAQNPFMVEQADVCQACVVVGTELRRQLERSGIGDEELIESMVAKAKCSEHGGADAPGQEVESTYGRKPRPNGKGYYSKDPRERALQLREDGKIGPQFAHLGGARRKRDKRAAEVVTEAAAEHAEKIKQVLLDGIDEGQPYSVRLKAALELLGVEERYAKEQAKQEQRDIENMTKAEMAAEVMELIGSIQRAGQLVSEVEQLKGGDGEIIDVEVVE